MGWLNRYVNKFILMIELFHLVNCMIRWLELNRNFFMKVGWDGWICSFLIIIRIVLQNLFFMSWDLEYLRWKLWLEWQILLGGVWRNEGFIWWDYFGILFWWFMVIFLLIGNIVRICSLSFLKLFENNFHLLQNFVAIKKCCWFESQKWEELNF